MVTIPVFNVYYFDNFIHIYINRTQLKLKLIFKLGEKNMKKVQIIILILSLFLFTFSQAQEKPLVLPNLKGPYLGQEPPGKTPRLFAPSIICTEKHEGCSGFIGDNTHFVFQRMKNGKVFMYEMKQKNGQWNQPKLVPFTNMMRNGDFTIAPNGRTLYFQSNIPIEELKEEGTISNIWVTTKTNSGWTKPKYLDFRINTKWHESYASVTNDGTLYFFSRKPGGIGKSDMYKSKLVDGKYTEAKNLGKNFNTEEHEWDPFISPDERYLIFCSTKSGGFGSDDFYISFSGKNGSWSNPMNMGGKINSQASENRPYVTPDGKYFFFTSTKRGNRDIYWVDAKILDDFRRK